MAHDRAARLSPAIHIVRSWTCRWCAKTPRWAMRPVSSKSEMDTVPALWSEVIRSCRIAAGNGCRQSTGGAVGSKASNQTPPMPWRHASQAPMSDGARGTSSMRRVGRERRESAINVKSSIAAKT